MLLGIGENAEERVDTLYAIREVAGRLRAHIQEVIVQPFHPKPGTPMQFADEFDERRWRVGSRSRAWCWVRR